jgi:hypothetical protein
MQNKELSEESGTGAIGVGAGPINTPYAFSKKKQKTNAATKESERLGFKKVPAGMPSDSKVKDYKAIWGKKKKYKIYKESDYDKASPYGQASGYTAASPYTGGGIKGDDYYKRENMDITTSISEDDKKKGSGKRFIPTEFRFPSFLLEPIKLGEKERIFFKVATNKEGESVLMIDPLVKTALDAIERGRSSFDKEQSLPTLTRFLKEKVSPNIRGLVKKYSQGAKINPSGFMILPLVLTKSGTEWNIKNPGTSSSLSDSVISINEKGIEFLRKMKNAPEQRAEFDKEIKFLVWLFKNKDREDLTSNEYIDTTGLSANAVGRVLSSINKEGMINIKKEDNIKKDINTPLYEKINKIIEEEMLNEVTYGKFKNEVKFRTKSEQLHKAIREVKRKLSEIDRIVEYTSRMKQELSEDEGGVSYWKATQKNVAAISEMVNTLNNKIKNLNQ